MRSHLHTHQNSKFGGPLYWHVKSPSSWVVTIEIVGRWPILAATPYNITTPLQRICRLQIRVHYENIEILDYSRCIFSSTQWKALSPSIDRYICNLIPQFYKNKISSIRSENCNCPPAQPFKAKCQQRMFFFVFPRLFKKLCTLLKLLLKKCVAACTTHTLLSEP